MSYQPMQVHAVVDIENVYTIFKDSYTRHFDFQGESHHFYELSYVISGSADITSDDKVYRCKSGDIALIVPNEFHRFKAGDEGCEIFTVSFDGRWVGTTPFGGKYLACELERQMLFGIMSELFESNSLPDDRIVRQIIKNRLELVCLSLIKRGAAAQGTPLANVQTECFTKAVVFMQNNIEKNLTTDDICRAVGQSPTGLKNIFRHFTGAGVIKYFNRMRAEHIKTLADSGQKVHKIASVMDFSSPYYLSYFFKRETGMTVREYLLSKSDVG